MFSLELLTAGYAGTHPIPLGVGAPVFNPAGLRAVFKHPGCSTSTQELLTAVQAGGSSASIAYRGTSTTVHKFSTAYFTGTIDGDTLEPEFSGEALVFTPELSICPGVARPAQGYEVIEDVGLQIRGERLEGYDMVNRAPGPVAMLAGVLIPRPGERALSLPVRTAILNSYHTPIIWN